MAAALHNVAVRTLTLLAVVLAAIADAPVGTFVASLSPAQRKKASIGFNDANRFDWHYVPRSRRGVPIGDLSQPQRELLHGFLRTGLSESGFRKTMGIIEIEPILGEIEGSSFRDPDRYYFSLFGDPAKTPWGWRFEGHHLSINATQTANGLSMTPMFLGANPARVPNGPRAGLRVLASEEVLGRQMLSALSAEQKKTAIIDEVAPYDIVSGTSRKQTLTTYKGLAASAMNPAQQQLLLRLVRNYAGNASTDVAEAEMNAIRENGVGNLHFAWAGGERPGQGHYYRIHGPTILIEYDNTQNGANHIHTVWRKPKGDFGDDLLAQHYATAKHHHHKRN